MDGFLVLFCGNMDDVPVRFFSNRDAAVALAGEIDLAHPAVQDAITALGREDKIRTESVTIVQEFVGGVPVSMEVVRDLCGILDAELDANMSNDA